MEKGYNISYTWDVETGTTICTLTKNGAQFIGKASCHPEDEDFKSEKSGAYLASQRALVKVYKHEKKQIEAIIKTLKHLQSVFTPKTREMKILLKEIAIQEEYKDVLEVMILSTKNNITNYISDQEDFFKKIRKHRNRGKIE